MQNNFNKKDQFRVGIYLRLSNEDRDKEEKTESSESIKNQRNMLKDYIEKHQEFIFSGEYCDEDLSGAGTYRPEFERLIADCEKRKLDVVLCKSQSRFSRDMEVVERYINNKFKEWNIRFIGISDNADTNNCGNKKARQINGLVNEWYLEDVSNNIRSAFNSKMKQGEFISPFASFGYEISKQNNNKLVVDYFAAEVVRKIFELYLKGLGFVAIAKYLNNENIPSPSLYKYQKGIKLNIISDRPREQIKWNANAIKKILTNELYLGHLIQGKRTTISYKNHKIVKKSKDSWIRKENTHEAIIDSDTFHRVQKLIKERTKPTKSTGSVHIFSGKVFCYECGCSMRKKNSQKHEYLVCSKNGNGYDECVNKSSIRYDKLKNIVLDCINKKIQAFYDIEELKKLDYQSLLSKINEKIMFLEHQRSDVKEKLIKTKQYLKKLYEDKVEGIITLKQFQTLVEDYRHDEDIYEKQLVSIDNDIALYKKQTFALMNKNRLFHKYQTFDSLNRFIVDEFIQKIYVSKLSKAENKRTIEIKWNF